MVLVYYNCYSLYLIFNFGIIIEGEKYTLNAQNPGAEYEWNNNESTQTIEGSTSGLYSVIVSDTLGCEETDDVLLTVLERIIIPNSFSPNGDGINDFWEINGLNQHPNASIQIINRWGNKVHEQLGEYIPWDGRQGGKEVPEGVYFYIISLNDKDKQIIQHYVTILR